MKDNKEYYYKLCYKNDDVEIEHKFSADLNLRELVSHFQDFMKACSWLESQADEVQVVEND